MVNELLFLVQYLLHRLPRVIKDICHLEEVDELGQAFNDHYWWVLESLELCHITHFDSLMRIQQALSSLADFDSVVVMAGRERLRLFLLAITPSIAMVPLDTAAPSCGSVSLMPGLSLLHIGAIVANPSLASILCVIEILGSNEYSSEAPTRC